MARPPASLLLLVPWWEPACSVKKHVNKFSNWPLSVWHLLHINTVTIILTFSYKVAAVGNERQAITTQKHKRKQSSVKVLWNMCSTVWLFLSYLYTCQPLSDGCEALLGCDVIHHNHTVGLAKELLGDASIPVGGGGGGGGGSRQKEAVLCVHWYFKNQKTLDCTYFVQKYRNHLFKWKFEVNLV